MRLYYAIAKSTNSFFCFLITNSSLNYLLSAEVRTEENVPTPLTNYQKFVNNLKSFLHFLNKRLNPQEYQEDIYNYEQQASNRQQKSDKAFIDAIMEAKNVEELSEKLDNLNSNKEY